MIRFAVPDDREEIARVHAAAIRASCSPCYSADEIAAWTAGIAPAIYTSALEDKTVVVDEEEGEIAGFGILDTASGEVHAVYVHPARGGRGIGSALLARTEAIAREEGIDVLRLKSTLNAVEFYRRRGYGGDTPASHPLAGGLCLTCVAMEKRLGPATVARTQNRKH